MGEEIKPVDEQTYHANEHEALSAGFTYADLGPDGSPTEEALKAYRAKPTKGKTEAEFVAGTVLDKSKQTPEED